MTTEDDFHAALDAQPEYWQTRLVFADWLQERNDPRADGYRALGVLRLYPSSEVPQRRCWGVASYAGPSRLPDDWFVLVKGTLRPSGSLWCDFNTRREAEDTAARAFAELPAERRAELTAPG